MTQPIITLQEITAETLSDVLLLKVAPHQENFVSPNAHSISEAYFEEKAWFRGIYADDTPVGFVMMFEDVIKPEYYLWRFMIDAAHQGKGYGAKVLKLLIDRIKALPNATEMTLSVDPGEGNAAPFYEKFGFVDTGEIEDGEMVFVLKFDK
ncbi:MAG: GNAT family N-acetyltransferase [Anaerolineae bacterium]